jgi:6-phosphogluconate dehydrogenase
MQIGMVGLGKMGASMVVRLLRGGHRLVVSDLDVAAVENVVKEGAFGATDFDDLVSQLDAPRVVWVMVPSGNATENVIQSLAEGLQAGVCGRLRDYAGEERIQS